MGFWQEARSRYGARRSVAAMQEEASRTKMRRTLRARDLTALGVGAIVGAGVFATTGVVAAERAGPGVALSFILAALVALLAGLAYAELAAMIPLAGSAYTYSFAAGGELFAWLIGWALVLSYGIGNAAVASAFSDNFTGLLTTTTGFTLSEALSSAPSVGGVFDVPAFLVVLLVTVLLLRPVNESTTVNTILVVIKVGVLLLFVAVAAPRGDVANLTPFVPFGAKGIFTGAALIFFAFIGFDAISTAAEETKDPQKALPRGIIGSLAIVTGLFIAVALSLTALVPYTDLNTGEPLAVALRIAGLPGLSAVMNAGGLLAGLSVLLVFQMATARVILALARDGLFPPWFAKLSDKYDTPNRLTLILGLIVAVSSAFAPLTFLIEATNIATLFIFAGALLSLLLLRKRDPDAHRPFRCPAVPVVPVLGILATLGLTFGLTRITWLSFIAYMGVGLIIYASYGASHSTLRANQAALRTSTVASSAALSPDEL